VTWLGQEDGITFYSLAGAMLMVEDGDGLTVLPVYSGKTMPFYGDFDGDGTKEIVCGSMGEDPAVIRKAESGWDVQRLCDVSALADDVDANLKFSWEERADDYLLHVTYGGLDGTFQLAEKGSVNSYAQCYYYELSQGEDGTFLFPVEIYLYGMDTQEGTGIDGEIYFSVDLDGHTEPVSMTLTLGGT
jgi:hypothetical protein